MTSGFDGSTHSTSRRHRRGVGEGRAPRIDIALDPDADPYAVARTIVLNQLTDRARSRAELRHKLADRNVPDDVAEAVLDRMAEVNLVDDAAFAQAWVRSRHRSKGLAKRSLAAELHRKGVEPEVARAALDGLDPDSERASARDLVARKLRSTQGQDSATRLRKLAGLLARKGYPAGLAYEVVRQALAEEGIETPEVVD